MNFIFEWWKQACGTAHGRNVPSQFPRQMKSPPGNIKKWLLIAWGILLFRALANNMAPITNHLTLFCLNISHFLVCTLCPCVFNKYEGIRTMRISITKRIVIDRVISGVAAVLSLACLGESFITVCLIVLPSKLYWFETLCPAENNN